MASVKKTMKSSETKKAKKPGIRTPKAKASKRFAVSKAQKTVTKPALAAKKAAAKKAAAKVAAKKVSAKLAAKTLSAKTNAAKALAAKQLAAKKAAQKAKLKTKMAPAAPSRAAAAKNMNGNMTKKKTQAATRASASRSQTTRGAKQAAARRGKPEATRATAAKRITATKRVEAVRHAAAPKTSARKVLRGKAAEAEVALRKPADSKTGAVQKPAAGKETAAALLAFKQNVARLTEARKRAAVSPPLRPAVNSSNLSLEPSEPMTVTKEAKKVASMKTAPSADIKSTPPAATDTARETARKGAKGTAPMQPKASAKLPEPKATPPVENRSVALAPVASDVSQVSIAEARPMEKAFAGAPKPAKAANPQRQLFKPGEFVVYPAHGVGQIIAIEEQEVAGFKLELYVISFIKDKMVLKVPTPKAASVGMRKLADATAVKMALDTLAGRARIKRTMWSRRAQEYEAKINSGDLNAIAEVVRDLYRSDTQPEQSYSERQLYEAALDRMTREIVVVQKLTETESLKVIEGQLQKGPRRGKAEDIDAEEADIEEAA